MTTSAFTYQRKLYRYPAIRAMKAMVTPPRIPLQPRGDASRVRHGPRVGLSAGEDTPWRFWLDGEPTVSVYRPHVPRLRR